MCIAEFFFKVFLFIYNLKLKKNVPSFYYCFRIILSCNVLYLYYRLNTE